MLLIRNEKLRNAVKIAVPFFIIPTITILGALVFDGKRHILIALAVAVLSLVLFAAGLQT